MRALRTSHCKDYSINSGYPQSETSLPLKNYKLGCLLAGVPKLVENHVNTTLRSRLATLSFNILVCFS